MIPDKPRQYLKLTNFELLLSMVIPIPYEILPQ